MEKEEIIEDPIIQLMGFQFNPQFVSKEEWKSHDLTQE